MKWIDKMRQAKRGLSRAAVRGDFRRYGYWSGVHYRLMLRLSNFVRQAHRHDS